MTATGGFSFSSSESEQRESNMYRKKSRNDFGFLSVVRTHGSMVLEKHTSWFFLHISSLLFLMERERSLRDDGMVAGDG